MKKTAIKATKYFLTSTLTAGIIIAVGTLSYCGMMVIFPYTPAAWAAFFLNGVVDGEVFKQNIWGGIHDPLLLGRKGYHELIIRALDDYISKHPEIADKHWFLKDYVEWCRYAASFRDKELSTEDQLAAQAAEKRVRRMQKYFVNRVLAKNPIKDRLALFVNSFAQQLPQMETKVWALRGAAVVSVLAGIALGLTTAASLTTAAASTTALLLPFVFPLAAVAFLAYSLMTFHNMKRIIFTDTFEKWQERFHNWFHYKPKSNKLTYALRITLAALLVIAATSLSVIATLTTGYTWWQAIENGYLRKLLIPASIFANLLFSLKNSMDSVEELLKRFIRFLKHPFADLKKQYAETRKQENNLQFLNPARGLEKFLSLSYYMAVFFGHSAAVGVIGDQVPGFETISAAAGGASDAFQDACYVFGHEHELNEENHADHHHKHAKSAFKSLIENDEGHSHTIPDYARLILLSPVLFLSSLWNWHFSKANIDTKKPTVSFEDALRQNFSVHHHEHVTEKIEIPPVSRQWLVREMTARFAKERKHIIASNEPIAILSGLKNIAEEERNLLESFKKRRNYTHNPAKLFSKSSLLISKVAKDYANLVPSKSM